MRGIMNIDEEEALRDLFSHPGWKPLLKAIDHLTSDQEQLVLKYQVSDGADGLVHLKLRAEGARKLSRDIAQLKQLDKKAGK